MTDSEEHIVKQLESLIRRSKMFNKHREDIVDELIDIVARVKSFSKQKA